MRPAVFLDRDGVLNGLVPDPQTGRPESPLRVEDAAPLPGAPEAIEALRKAGWAVVVVSNQPSVAKGKTPLDDLRAVHHHLRDALPPLDGWRYCLHHPEATVSQLAGPCACRKPAPGLLVAAAFELDLDLPASWMVGDSDTDVQAGVAAGCRTVLVEHPDSAHRRSGTTAADRHASDVSGAVRAILGG